MVRPLREALLETPVTIAEARRSPEDGGLPEAHGLYVWWAVGNEVLPEVPTPPHPSDPTLRLLYIGTAPEDERSSSTLRSRVLNNHCGLPLSGSTLRRTLTALLWQQEGWTPQFTRARKWTMPEEDRLALRSWMERNLRLAWLEIEQPWKVERIAIEELQPPLNLAKNAGHPFYETLWNARRMFETFAARNQA